MSILKKRKPCQSKDHEWKDKGKVLDLDNVVVRDGLVMLYSAWYIVTQKCIKCGKKRTIGRVDELELM